MVNSKISLALLISEIINEVGDLKNIETYEYSISKTSEMFTGEFTAILPSENKTEIKVFIVKMDPTNKVDIELPPIFEINYPKIKSFSIAYTIKGEDAQYDKTDFKTYAKIMATVVKIVKDIISQNEKIYYKPLYLFLSTSKMGEMGTQDTKLKYYQAILNNNLPSGYRMGKGKFAGMNIIALQKIKD
jgi:hypothetical protein